MERAKQVTMAELNAIIGVGDARTHTHTHLLTMIRRQRRLSVSVLQQQQLHAQHLSHGHAIPIPLTPHPAGLQPPLAPGASTASLLALSSALSHQLPLKDDRKHHDSNNGEHARGE